MAERTKTGQKQHDSGVHRWIRGRQKEGFKTKADLPRYKKPSKIGGYFPDGWAKKGKIEKLLEVETSETLETDKEQRAAFRKWADQSPNRTFFTRIVKKKK